MTLYGLYAKRYKLTIGYVAFYALILAALNFGVVAILGRYGSYLPFAVGGYLSSDMLGVSYVYTLVALSGITLCLFLSPAALRLDAAYNNQWYLLSKCGFTPTGMVNSRVLLALVSVIGVYLLGFAIDLGVGALLLFSFSTGALLLVGRLAAIGVLCLLCILLVPMAVSTLLRAKFPIGLCALLVAAGLGLYLATEDFFNSAAQESLQASVVRLTSFSVPCLALLTIVLCGASVLLIYLRSQKRILNYEEPELDENALVALGIEADTLVLERGAHKYDVVISGPEVNGEEDRDIEIPRLSREDADIPEEEDAPQEADEAPEPRKRGLFGRRDEDAEADDEEEDEVDDEDEDEDDERPRRRGLFGRRRRDDEDEEEDEEDE
ncbi:MAG: hypothetical protein VB092_03775 [Oscillospiraceae bacterium]|nr:hypothetical protein [Oscillospiraceae bacterium]